MDKRCSFVCGGVVALAIDVSVNWIIEHRPYGMQWKEERMRMSALLKVLVHLPCERKALSKKSKGKKRDKGLCE